MERRILKLIAQSLAVRLLLAAACGAAVGLFVYLLRGIGGYPLYLLVGVTAGVMMAGLVHLYVRSVSLTEIKVNVPQLSQLTFVVNNDAKRTAWEIFVEVSTRISTQPLGQEAGFLREALNSLYSLFGRTRELLAQAQPTRVTGGHTVEYLALTMLNHELRPFLSTWHPRLARFEQTGKDEADWDDNIAFRAELEQLRQHLVEFALSFARLAGVVDPQSLVTPAGTTSTSSGEASR
jgi:hypothetical protein